MESEIKKRVIPRDGYYQVIYRIEYVDNLKLLVSDFLGGVPKELKRIAKDIEQLEKENPNQNYKFAIEVKDENSLKSLKEYLFSSDYSGEGIIFYTLGGAISLLPFLGNYTLEQAFGLSSMGLFTLYFGSKMLERERYREFLREKKVEIRIKE